MNLNFMKRLISQSQTPVRSMTIKACASKRLDNLPKACQVLPTKSQGGSNFFLIGIKPNSMESKDDVVAVMKAVEPDVAVLQLSIDNTDFIDLDAQEAFAKYPTNERRLILGNPYRTAYQESQRYGCRIRLGDRPDTMAEARDRDLCIEAIEDWYDKTKNHKAQIDLSTRAKEIPRTLWNLLRIRRIAQKIDDYFLIDYQLDPDEYRLEKIKELMQKIPKPNMSEEYCQKMVEERETYLAYSLQQAAAADTDSSQPPAVVVGVVDNRLVNGIARKLHYVNIEDVARTMYSKEGVEVVLKTEDQKVKNEMLNQMIQLEAIQKYPIDHTKLHEKLFQKMQMGSKETSATT